jgi:hypothetical protein
MLDPARRKSLHARYSDDRPRRLLAMDGGGIRGLLTLGILEHLEALPKKKAIQRMDAVEDAPTPLAIGRAAARSLDVAHFGSFL